MAYIPHGADQQGRRITGIWTAPHRTHRGDFADTYPTGPAPLDGAHAASDIQGAEPQTPGLVQRFFDRLTPRAFWVCYALGIVVLVGLAVVHAFARWGGQ